MFNLPFRVFAELLALGFVGSVVASVVISGVLRTALGDKEKQPWR